MSEYQYYEFCAVDRPLDRGQLAALRAISTRAHITATSFTNTYQWGDLKADPRMLVERYFDAHLYLANWGTHRLMVKLPAALLSLESATPYAAGDSASVHSRDGSILLDWYSHDEDGADEEDWDDGTGHLAAVIGIRGELAAGDLRPLYLGWLAALPDISDPDTVPEPLVPMGLAALTGPQQALADFLRVDPHLLRAAGAASASAAVQDDRELARWIAALPAADKDDLLLRLARYGSTGLGSDLLRCYRRSQPPGAAAEPRTAAALIEAADSLRSATAQGGR
ncbi:hypothetical protein ABZ612_34550 [Streptomyces avermitilis]|uniref:hypothetical protein n=1 Tax=Streptomyces avermitilis TaxID=33903 RepID=UPI0033C2E027